MEKTQNLASILSIYSVSPRIKILGLLGSSYAESIPVKFLNSPRRAFFIQAFGVALFGDVEWHMILPNKSGHRIMPRSVSRMHRDWCIQGWSCPTKVDTWLCRNLSLECIWADVSKGRMAAGSVIVNFDVLKQLPAKGWSIHQRLTVNALHL